MSVSTVDLRNRAFTPAIIQEIVKKLSDKAVVCLCQTSTYGWDCCNLYRRQAVEQYVEAMDFERQLLSTDYWYIKHFTIGDAQNHAEMERACVENVRQRVADEANQSLVKELEEEAHWAEKHATSRFILKSENFVGLFPTK